MKLPDAILLAVLKNKKSVSEILKFCDDKEFCKNPKFQNDLGKMLFKVSGYKTARNFDYHSLFKEMSKITLKNRIDDPVEMNKPMNGDIDVMKNNILKITPYIRKALAASGSKELYEFLLYNGIDLRKESTFGVNFDFKSPRFLSSTN